MGTLSQPGLARRALLSAFAASVPVLALGGCQNTERQPGEIIIGSSDSGVPFSFIDPWTNELAGSMVDTAEAITAALKLKPDLRVVAFSALIPSLVVGKIDMIAAAMLRTDEREKIVAFSDPVYAFGGGLVMREGDGKGLHDLAALRGKRVGAQVGTMFVDQLKDAGVQNIATYENLSDLLRDLGHGRIEAAYGDEPIVRYQLQSGARPGLAMVSGFKSPSKLPLCLVLRKGDPMMAPLNAAIAQLQQATIPAIKKKWGLSDG